LVRGEKESLVKSKDNIMTAIQITGEMSLMVIESYFRGMVGEMICAYSYFVIDIHKDKPKTTPINTPEELKALYKFARGKRTRMSLWYFIKNFNGWSEDPIPYVI
jgi:hypothetical protein